MGTSQYIHRLHPLEDCQTLILVILPKHKSVDRHDVHRNHLP
jgi:hypothetical protein